MKIDHIAMYVNDLENAKAFFVNYFGATANGGYHNTKTDFRSYFLTFESGTRLEIMTRPDLCDSGSLSNRFGYAHIAFSVGSIEAVNTSTQRLKEDGYTVISGPRITGDGYYESCIAALEGNLIEITA